MLTLMQYRESAKEFTINNLQHLCAEMVRWADSGSLGRAPYFHQLTETCKMFAGIEFGRKVAENMVRHEAMRRIATNGT